MKYAITGHTQGVGKRAYERLSPDIIGFSRSTGYDINDPVTRKKIVDLSYDCDVFINNATDNFAQTYMFLDIVEAWYDKPEKTIINVGSRIAEVRILPESHRHLSYYHAEKLALKQFSNQYALTANCKISYRWFAYVGTEKILRKYPHFTPNDYITEDAAVDIILS
jgi:short-subunit dehydrogenase